MIGLLGVAGLLLAIFARVPIAVALALSVAILGLMAWRGFISAKDAVELGDVTSDLSLPRIYYWIPVLAGMVGAALTALVMLFARDEKKDGA